MQLLHANSTQKSRDPTGDSNLIGGRWQRKSCHWLALLQHSLMLTLLKDVDVQIDWQKHDRMCLSDISPERKGNGGESIYGPTFEGKSHMYLLYKVWKNTLCKCCITTIIVITFTLTEVWIHWAPLTVIVMQKKKKKNKSNQMLQKSVTELNKEFTFHILTLLF